MHPCQTLDDLVAAFGGTNRLAAALGYRSGAAVSNWRKEGIAKSRWPDLIEIAEAQRIPGVTLARLRAINNAVLLQSLPAPPTQHPARQSAHGGRRAGSGRPPRAPRDGVSPISTKGDQDATAQHNAD